MSGKKALLHLLILCIIVPFACSGCASRSQRKSQQEGEQASKPDTSRFLVSLEDEPDTTDFQCTTIHYTIAQNVFNRLVEVETDADGRFEIVPSLAESWEISDDGRSYTFHLRENVTFSNGSALTSSDVQYSFVRLLTHPDSCNRDIAEGIEGSDALRQGKTAELSGFRILSDRDFVITLEEPFQAFLACLSMPGASILDEETTKEAGDRFGRDPAFTIGTGSFIFWKWIPGEGLLLKANPDCWQGPPRCEGLDLRFINDPQEIRRMFERGEIDVLDLDEVGNMAEFYLHGDIYQDRLFHFPRIGITYIALNESVKPLDDVRVRKAMQLSLNRPLLLEAVYGGRGYVENGIYPRGLYGFNPELPEIPFDPDAARRLLEEAGYPDGFPLTISVSSSSTIWEMSILRLAAAMWDEIGIRTSIRVLDDSEFMMYRTRGLLACYTAQWMADFNDPDNFIYTFFGSRANSIFRSLCYFRDDVIKRVRLARNITDPQSRIREYQELEKIIVQEDAAWIPLYSRMRYFVTSERLEGITADWNGSVKNNYREMSVAE